jgi:hypothetical protein
VPKLEDNISRETPSVSSQELCCVLRNVFKKCQDCSEAGSLHIKLFYDTRKTEPRGQSGLKTSMENRLHM